MLEITTYHLQQGTEERVFHSLDELENVLNERIGKRDYIIQQGIPLMKHENLPFDLRVLTQKNLQNNWETTGIVGRVLCAGKNYHQYSRRRPSGDIRRTCTPAFEKG